MQNLTDLVQEFTLHEGACKAGVTTLETLAGGPPSSDLTYVLPEAQSAISFAVAIDQQTIEPYLQKQDRLALERAVVQANAVASGISFHLANFLNQKGFASVPVAANNVFRPKDPALSSEYIGDSYYPDIAHRYLAVRSGIGHMGLSGNLITQEHGAAVILATTVTSARLLPTGPLPDRENYCDNCRLCMAACAAGFMHHKEKTELSLGGHPVSYAKRRNYGRCDLVCSGYTGLHPTGRWSTWSPGRFAIPECDDDLRSAYTRQQNAHSKWPTEEGGRYFFFMNDKLRISCANCQFICCPDKNERKARYNMLVGSGVILQDSDGRRRAVPPEKAHQVFASMPAWQKKLYEDV
jgi:epoxyqueuosine reductase QueG